MYCLLTVFQAAIYFSIQFVKHAVSPLDNDDPGLGTHFSKQCSLTFYMELVIFQGYKEEAYLNQLPCILHGGFLFDLVHKSLFGI